ncbi:TetR/AcrR family transcriptional regulator [Amycolatopsis sp. NPDC051061]|uniref:TetR/AcrR family transcriptional regulator n=1 Tax=Amycolatopsis sp. NPDC051061 TaxID=3155042 RepID=UPI0034142A2F
MPGRPRDTSRDAVIFDATLELLTGVGYDKLSMDSIAAMAGVGKATIYRRYSGKAALVAAAVDHRAGATPPAVEAADLRGALLEIVRWLAREIAEQEIGLLGALFAGMRGDPDLAAAMRRIAHRDQAAMTRQPLDDGLLDPRGAALFAEIVPAMVVHRLVIVGEPCDERFLEHLVDDILLRLLKEGSRP